MAEVADRMIEEARELVSNRLLWPLVRDFLWDFSLQVHPSWGENLFSRRDAEGRRSQREIWGAGALPQTPMRANRLILTRAESQLL